MEGHRGREPCRLHRLQERHGRIRTDTEFRPEIISRPGDRQFQANRHLGTRRDQTGELGKLSGIVDRIGRDAEPHRRGNLGPRAHRIVVMERRPGRDRPHRRHFVGRGHVKRGDPGGDKVFQNRTAVIGLDRIGHQTGETRLKPARGGLQNFGGEIENRGIGARGLQMLMNAGPNCGLAGHRRQVAPSGFG